MLQAGVTPIVVQLVGQYVPYPLAVALLDTDSHFSKFSLTFSSLLAAGGGALLANANTVGRYWRIVAPGQVLVGLGAGMSYICCSQALIQTGSPAISGVLGAIWTSALQFGLVVAIAVCLALISAFDVSRRLVLYTISMLKCLLTGT